MLPNGRIAENRVYFHVDLDAFYASVEQIDNPEYRGKPVIVGAKPGSRGVVSTCSYEARKFGIKSAMPISTAYKLCPNGIYLPVRMKRYMEVSRTVMDVLKDYTPGFQQISIDEAFLDMTGTERLFGPPLEIAKEIKQRIKEKTGLTLSIGIAPNRYLAKLASDYSKPDGLYIVEPEKAEEFVEKLKLTDLWGIGKKTIEKLKELNITTVKRLKNTPKTTLSQLLGKAAAEYLYKAARGIDPGIHQEDKRSHSISSEMTFQKDLNDIPQIYGVLFELSSQIMYRLLKEKKRSKTVVLKIRYNDFTTFTIQKSLKHWFVSSDEVYQTAKELFNLKWERGKPIRLLGLGFNKVELLKRENQGELFENNFNKIHRVEETIIKLKSKDSNIKITRASLLKPDISKYRKHNPG